MNKIENFIALRYIRENRKNKEISGSSKIVIVTIAAAVIFYICAVSVMNGYIQGRMQLQFELTSFHLNYYDIDRESVAMDICEQLDKNFDVAVNYYFRETKVLLSANRINTGLTYFRSVPANVFLTDKGLNKYVRLIDGDKDLSAGNILISGKTAAKMKLKVGDTLHICAVMAGSDAQVRYKKCTVAGIFSTGFTELDEQLAFIGDDTNVNLFDERVKYTVAVKLFDYRKAAEFAHRNKFSGYAAVSTWEEENYNELSALKFEKSVIALIVILVIIVAVLNILTTIHITVMEKQTDIGVLKAIGYSPRQVVSVFLLVGYYLGMIGVCLGTVLGLSIMHSLNDIMVGLGSIANGYMDIINAICGLFASLPPIDRIEIYASDFYLDKIYTDIGFGEVLFVAFLTVHFALAASIIPAMRTRNIKPNEVIKNG